MQRQDLIVGAEDNAAIAVNLTATRKPADAGFQASAQADCILLDAVATARLERGHTLFLVLPKSWSESGEGNMRPPPLSIAFYRFL